MESRPSSSLSSSKVDRKTIEKNRRDEMKSLLIKLNSLVPHQQDSISSSREHASLLDQVDVATKYVKELETRMAVLKEKKSNLLKENIHIIPRSSTKIEVHVWGNSVLEVALITGLDCYTIFVEAIRVVRDEGVEVVNASISRVNDTSVFHTIHGKIEESAESCQGIVGRITERLKSMMLSLDS